jgi:hypothetical protein
VAPLLLLNTVSLHTLSRLVSGGLLMLFSFTYERILPYFKPFSSLTLTILPLNQLHLLHYFSSFLFLSSLLNFPSPPPIVLFLSSSHLYIYIKISFKKKSF